MNRLLEFPVFYTDNLMVFDLDTFDWVELVEINKDHVIVVGQPSLMFVVVDNQMEKDRH
jgi:hypothetical protein